MPGLAWVEITYFSPSKGCHRPARNSFQKHDSADLNDNSCVQSFVFVGDMISMGQSLHLTSYQPRWEIDIGAYLPDVLEKHFICAFHVSLILALLNSLPVRFYI
jgi:S2P endopeptidase